MSSPMPPQGAISRTLSPSANSDMRRSWTENSAVSSIPSIPEDGQTIDNYSLGRTVGKGNFAKVKLATHILTGVEVAIKIVDKSCLNESSIAKLLREVRIMKIMDHPNIVKLYEVIDTESTMYLVMEYAAGGEVFDYLVEHGRMKEKDARLKFRQIVSAVEYCHACGVIHRDLKAENLLLDSDMNIKIADFGFSNVFDPGDKLDTFCGSPPYAAPELFQGKKYDGPEVDVWSLGVILYTLVSGSLPFDGTSLKELRERVLRGKYRIPFYMSQECEQLLKRFLAVAPSRRSTLRAVMEHEWMNIDNDPLEPHTNVKDSEVDMACVKAMTGMKSSGFTADCIIDSVRNRNFDHQHATYMLMQKVGWKDDNDVDTSHEVPKSMSSTLPSISRRQSTELFQTPILVQTGSARPHSVAIAVGGTNNESSTDTDRSIDIPIAPTVSRGNDRRLQRSQTDGKIELDGGDSGMRNRSATAHNTDTQPTTNRYRLQRSHTDFVPSTSSGEAEGRSTRQPVRLRPRRSTEGDSHGPPQRSNTITHRSDPIDVNSSPTRRSGGILGSFRRKSSKAKLDVANKGHPQPRSLRFTFSRANTSSRDAGEILYEMQRVLTLHGIKYQRSEPFVLVCTHEHIQFEMEVCKLPRLSMHGIRHRRIKGDSLSYKNICSRILTNMAPFLEGGSLGAPSSAP